MEGDVLSSLLNVLLNLVVFEAVDFLWFPVVLVGK